MDMACVCGVKILLFWSAFFCIANFSALMQPAPGANTTAIPTDWSAASNPVQPTGANVSGEGVPVVQCNFTVTAVDSGYKLHFSSSHNGSSFIITISEMDGESYNMTYDIGLDEILILKPCTNYTLSAFDDRFPETVCYHRAVKTKGMTLDQIRFDVKMCNEIHRCFDTPWNITGIVRNPSLNDTCTNMTESFPSENCTSSFPVTNYLGVDFYPPTEVTQTKYDFPAKIIAQLPEAPKCNITQIYTCSGHHGEWKTLSELEPFTNYNCFGQIKDSTGAELLLPPMNFHFECDLVLVDRIDKISNNSINFSWSSKSKKCEEKLNMTRISYQCSCQKIKKGDPVLGNKCNITGLTPFTNYTCEIQPLYDGKQLFVPQKVTRVTTKAGVPGNVTHVKITLTKHNQIEITCKGPSSFYGEKQIYMANLSDGSQDFHQQKGNCALTFKDLKYSTTYELKLYTFNGNLSGHVWLKTIPTLYNDKAIIGVLVFFIILILLALLFVSYKIYRLKRTKSRDLNEKIGLIPVANEEENLRLIDPIPAELLLETYKLKAADEARLFLAEFQSIPRIFSRYHVKEAKKSVNVPKNRYIDILPYDYNRVQLTTGNGETGCDYINASFIDGFKELKKYIAAQGPKEETLGDFWRMIWEQKSSIIVMVTRCEESKRPKCMQYWPSPSQDVETYEEFVVQLKSEELCPNYIIRHLTLMNKKEKSSEREVTHIQFISWPDHGVPSEAHLLLKLRRRVNAFKNLFSGPIVVHCSAGVGRTGTYISIDAMMESLEAEGHVDIFGFVVTLRKQRCLMVQVEGQYTLIHQALLEHTLFGDTEISLAELHSAMATLKQRSSDTEPTLMEEEFERLANYKNWRTTNTGITEENKMKNRSMAVIPYDYNRVLIMQNEGVISKEHDDEDDDDSSVEEEEDEHLARYINASYINGYWGPRSFITTQTPMPETTADFWLMVYQNNASMVVMFSDTGEDGKESDLTYWDTDNKAYGDIEVEMTSTKTYPTFISRNALIRHIKRKESRPVKHVQFLHWKTGELPESPQVLMDFMKEVRSSSGPSKSLSTTPIVVHCNDGSSRSGIFCALWNLLDCAETEKVVDIFQVSKTLCKERQGLLSSLNQYQFLYDALETLYPLQNGSVKAELESDCVQVVDETTAAEQPQIVTVDSEEVKEEVKEGREPESSSPTETNPLEEASNSTTVIGEL
ncbi:receptor-type tyrosine-protein phosphatase C isoform X2 [Synchiropus splendidus]|uniref:receptor-type tyrosine-protein phosphatase C isoform X2 n=1 Tax=Synchiropus splendidus TaxID=270530 RepID=UPI00237E008B|nr:receptor-type tyrosine-protein phosphatase C isoform X2 [Synchiropus splendidus]